MPKLLLKTFLGIGLSVSAIYVTYLFLVSINEGGNPWLLLLATVLVTSGVFFLYKAGQSDESVIAKVVVEDNQNAGPSLQSTLEKNSKLVTDWENTMEVKDRLKLLEIQSNAENPQS